MSGYKNPPKFDEGRYDEWKNELKIWDLVTDLQPEKKALAVTLSLSGKAKEVALSIKAEDLNKNDGLKILTEKLDGVYLRDSKDKTYDVYTRFDSFRKHDEMTMSEYTVEFDQRYQKCKSMDMALPDAILAFKLLDGANLSLQERQLALTAIKEITYEEMKIALRRIFSNQNAASKSSDTFGDEIKGEPSDTAFYTANKNYRGYFNRSRFGAQNSGYMGKTNPLNRYGQPTKCKICSSVYHWWKKCPHKKQDKVNVTESGEFDGENVEECNITLFNTDSDKIESVFTIETQNAAVIDTACSRTVCGEKWLKTFIDSAGCDVPCVYSRKPFRFGDGKIVHSYSKAELPVQIANTKCCIETEVVKADIPLLLSKASLKKAGTQLDMKNDKAVMFDQPVTLQFTSSGHYCIELLSDNVVSKENIALQEVLLTDTHDMSQKEKVKMLTKLHKQFGHSSAGRLKKLLQNSGNRDTCLLSLLDKIVSECPVCMKFRKPAPKPIVGYPLATDYNQTVALDLHQINKNTWYLHIIDEFSRYSAGCITKSKEGSHIAKCFMKYWIAIHGPPSRLFSDNGGEFNNRHFQEMAEQFNIEILTTPGFSPWSNGLLERHNKTLTEILTKVQKDTNLDWDTAFCWALMAKNSLHNNEGFSPQQLVFARNPNLPSVLIDSPPALEGVTNCESVGKHITALYATREAYIKAESSERIQRALRAQTRPSPDVCEIGDKVYYKRPDRKEWKGPAVVIGQDGPVVFVRHGGIVVRVHKCRLTKIPCAQDTSIQVTDKIDNQKDNTGALDIEYSSDSDDDDKELTQNNIPNQPMQNHDLHIETVQSDTQNLAPDTITNNVQSIKPGQIIEYTCKDTGNTIASQVLSRAGKAQGKQKHWFNIQCLSPDEYKGAKMSVDMSKLNDLRVRKQDDRITINMDTNAEPDVLVTDHVSMESAKSDEIQCWKNNKVFDEVKDIGQSTISTRWVCTLKTTDDGTGIKPKARLVARGFEEFNENVQKESPTCAHESLRVLLSVITNKKWKLNAMDIKTAYLQGTKLDRDIFLKPPKECSSPGIIWKLNKCVYGLNDASLHWYRRVKEVMLECGGSVSKVDPSIFYWHNKDGQLVGVLACHVDDFIWGGTAEFERVISHIKETLEVGKEGHTMFQFCGIDLEQKNGDILLSQEKYAENITSINVEPKRALEKDACLTESETSELRSKVGQLLWLSHQSRPDLLFDTTVLATAIKNGTIKHLFMANKLINRAKTQTVHVKFQPLGEKDMLKLVLFSDAALGNLTSGGSQGGYIVFIVGKDGNCSPVWWNSRKIRRVVRSTLAAETLAMSDGVDIAIFISTLFTELLYGPKSEQQIPIVCYTDCKSLYEAVKSQKYVTEKRLRIEISGLKESIENGRISKFRWCNSKQQLADSLTKCGASPFALQKVFTEGKIDIDTQ